jgi:FkbM family methyltransferase
MKPLDYYFGHTKGACEYVRQKLKHSVHIKSFCYRLLWMLPERFRTDYRVRQLLVQVAQARRNVVFMNIGANDGLAGDPLREFVIRRGWQGVLVEPVDYVFRRLAKAYRGCPGVICENAALADHTGTMPFWYLKKNAVLSAGYDQIGSFDKERVLGQENLFPGLRDYLAHSDVPCTTLHDLRAKHRLEHVDLYLIDTEGYDHQVVKQIEFEADSPCLVIYEVGESNPEDQKRTRALLESRGYMIEETHGNALAYKPSLVSASGQG